MKTKIWTALIALYIVWGSTYLAIRFGVETIPPFLLAGFRFLISGLLLIVWRRSTGDPLPTLRQWRSTAIIGTLLLLGGNGFLSFAEQRVPSGISALLIGTVPLWMVLIEALRPGGAKPGVRAVLGLLVGFGGIFLLVGPAEMSKGGGFDLMGIGVLLVASLLWAAGSIYARTAELPSSSLMATGAEMLCGSVSLFLFASLVGEWPSFHPAAVSIRSWLGLAYLIGFGSLIGFVAYGWLLKHAPVSLVATYAYVNPLVAILLGNLFAQEQLNARILAAAGIIIGSVLLINSRRPASGGESSEAVPLTEGD